jgi:hypothetical protein
MASEYHRFGGPGWCAIVEGSAQGIRPAARFRGRHGMTGPGRGDAARSLADYYPAWLDNLAGDVTLEGSAMDGVVQGAEVVRTVLVSIRALYDYQEFNSVGCYGENGWIEDYTAGVRGEPVGNITVITHNAAGQAQRIVGTYRPRSTLLLLSRLIGEKFAGTAIGEHFASGGS